MGKYLGVALIGIFVGAVLGEVLRKKKPELFENIRQKIKAGRAGIGSVIASFQEGYRETATAKAE